MEEELMDVYEEPMADIIETASTETLGTSPKPPVVDNSSNTSTGSGGGYLSDF